MIKYIDFNDLCERIKSYKNKKILISFHSVGDRDGVASSIALSSFFSNAIVITPDFITRNAKRMLDQINYKEKIKSKFPPDREVVIIVDTNNLGPIGKLAESLKQFKGSILFIDHHIPPKNLEVDATIFNNEKSNSASSIIYEVLKQIDAPITKENALLLLDGIIADSADLQNSTPQTFKQISELLEIAGTDYSEITEYFTNTVPSDSRSTLINDIQKATLDKTNDYVIMYGEATMHANVVADAAIKLGADASLFWSSNKENMTLSARLKPGLDKKQPIHLGRIMQEAAPIIKGSGGGHPCAAGLYGPKKSAEQKVINKILSKIKQKLSVATKQS